MSVHSIGKSILELYIVNGDISDNSALHICLCGQDPNIRRKQYILPWGWQALGSSGPWKL